jgi:hypothetical protein
LFPPVRDGVVERQTTQRRRLGGVPTRTRPYLTWIEHGSSKLGVAGSSPAGRAILARFRSIRFPIAQKFGRSVLKWSGHFRRLQHVRRAVRDESPLFLNLPARVRTGHRGRRSSVGSSIRGALVAMWSAMASSKGRSALMTPEERERFRQRLRERCGFDLSASEKQ